MRVFSYFVVLSSIVLIVSANFETCSDMTECSEGMKNKCGEMSKTLDETQKLIVACKNGICMCNIQFHEHPIAQVTPQNKEPTEKTERAEPVTEKDEDS